MFAIVLTVLGVLGAMPWGVSAQTGADKAPDVTGGPSIRIEVPAVVLAAPASEIRLPIALVPADGAPRASFLRIRGLPTTAALSDGHAIAPGAWAVPVAALPGLRITIPTGSGGKTEMNVALVTIDGHIIAETKSALVVAAAGLIAPGAGKAATANASPPAASMAASAPPPVLEPPAPKAPAIAAPAIIAVKPVTPPLEVPPPVAAPAALPPPAASQPPPAPPVAASPLPKPPPAATVAPPSKATPKELSPAVRQRAEGFLARGNGLLKEGNIALARPFFERAADDGLAEGAIAMGATYDAVELSRLRVQGLRPDRELARKWYEKARDLGSRDAEDRLKALAAQH